MEREHDGLSNAELLARGKAAHAKGDRALVRSYLAELQYRGSPSGRAAYDELRALAGNSRKGGAAAPGCAVSIANLTNVVFVCDQQVRAVRTEMVRAATRKVVLSTYQYEDKDDSFTKLLLGRARAGVDVRLYLSKGPVGRDPRADDQMEELADAGVAVLDAESTHSKCVVVDDAEVLIGSANLDKTWRDAALRARSPELAKAIEKYLEEIDRF